MEQFSLFLQEKRKLQMAEGLRENSNRLCIVGDCLSSCGKPDNKTQSPRSSNISRNKAAPIGELPCKTGFQNGSSPQVRSSLDALGKV